MAVFDHPHAVGQRILIVENNLPYCNLLESSLKNLGYRTTCVHSVESVEEVFCENEIDLILLDVVLPESRSIELCHKIRQASAVPIIAISALNRSSDIVALLNAGADEYIIKPVQFDYLEAIIFAQMRRYGGTIKTVAEPDILYVGSLKLNIATRVVASSLARRREVNEMQPYIGYRLQ